MEKWIVTNYGGGENYTPSVFDTEEEAREWMKECTAENIWCMYDTKLKKAGIDPDDDDAILRYANKNFSNVEISKNQTIVGEPEEGGNLMQIFQQ